MANFTMGTEYYGFILEKSENVKDINALVHLFKHQKSGAELLAIENDDNNKIFSVSFKTPPYDSTGLPHIIEHSVLNGSRKFDVKDPFARNDKKQLSNIYQCFYIT